MSAGAAAGGGGGGGGGGAFFSAHAARPMDAANNKPRKSDKYLRIDLCSFPFGVYPFPDKDLDGLCGEI